ncbi:hypothetical protein Srut_48160 [Streptomyces rutgersensis]|nr:hypothetical protein Srut_48160 [Streptomyces rutgersensis]
MTGSATPCAANGSYDGDPLGAGSAGAAFEGRATVHGGRGPAGGARRAARVRVFRMCDGARDMPALGPPRRRWGAAWAGAATVPPSSRAAGSAVLLRVPRRATSPAPRHA